MFASRIHHTSPRTSRRRSCPMADGAAPSCIGRPTHGPRMPRVGLRERELTSHAVFDAIRPGCVRCVPRLLHDRRFNLGLNRRETGMQLWMLRVGNCLNRKLKWFVVMKPKSWCRQQWKRLGVVTGAVAQALLRIGTGKETM